MCTTENGEEAFLFYHQSDVDYIEKMDIIYFLIIPSNRTPISKSYHSNALKTTTLKFLKKKKGANHLSFFFLL